VLLHSLPASALWCYITVMPFVFIKYMGVETHIFGYYILLQALAAAATSFYVQRVVTKHSSSKIMLNGLRLLFVGCVAMFIAALWVPKDPLIATFCVIPFLMGIPFIFPSSMAKAMSFVSHSKGTAASCIATARQFFALVGSLVAAALPDDTLFPTALYMLIVASCASACYYLAHKHDLAGEVIS
jgi:DHA1 family bicyclomycin/chloramphenicol resistance-like MFS transporter